MIYRSDNRILQLNKLLKNASINNLIYWNSMKCVCNRTKQLFVNNIFNCISELWCKKSQGARQARSQLWGHRGPNLCKFFMFKTPHMNVCMYNSVKTVCKNHVSDRGMNMIAARHWRSERVLRELCVGEGTASVLPDPSTIFFFGRVFST